MNHQALAFYEPHNAEALRVKCFKAGEELCAKGVDMQTKGEVLGMMQSLMGVQTEEATFTFSRVDWEVPFQRPFFKVDEGLLDSVGSFQWVRKGRPDGEIISIE